MESAVKVSMIRSNCYYDIKLLVVSGLHPRAAHNSLIKAKIMRSDAIRCVRVKIADYKKDAGYRWLDDLNKCCNSA